MLLPVVKNCDQIRMIKNKISRILKKVIGTKTIINPIIDDTFYPSMKNSFSGGSLADSNLLCISNKADSNESILRFFSAENCCTKVVNASGTALNSDDIINYASDLVGQFDHILNFVFVGNTCKLFDEQLQSFNDEDAVYTVYSWMQAESDYILKVDMQSTITTVFVSDGSIESEVMAASVQSCIEGLSIVLGRHNIVVNGIIACQSIPLNDVLRTAAYLSGKYGQILAGTVMDMRK